ncbi:hypothetical protein NUW58_g5168 [Xylaria curta]|uniref:Uncharacterized protein n=1 Tax=Xylaria curta TaxID=42375 RepID=A0ACC1P543_9PEZI|nr:hypothetical protein NUW58_g5168 [Xylaria curta]
MLSHSSTPAAAPAGLLFGSWDDPNSPVGLTTQVPPSNATMPEAYSRRIPEAWNTSVSDFDRVVGSEYKGKLETYPTITLTKRRQATAVVHVAEGLREFSARRGQGQNRRVRGPDKEISQSSTDGIDLYVNFNSGYAPPSYPVAPDYDNRCWQKNHLDDNYDDCSGTPYSHYRYIRKEGSEREGGSAGPDGVNHNLKDWGAVGSKRLEWPTLQHEIGHGLFFYDFRSQKLEQEFPSPPPDPDDDLPPTYVPENA